LKEIGVRHSTVNRSKYFKNPNTGVHTNTIKGCWSARKKIYYIDVKSEIL